jgi:hypothetical protein
MTVGQASGRPTSTSFFLFLMGREASSEESIFGGGSVFHPQEVQDIEKQDDIAGPRRVSALPCAQAAHAARDSAHCAVVPHQASARPRNRRPSKKQ